MALSSLLSRTCRGSCRSRRAFSPPERCCRPARSGSRPGGREPSIRAAEPAGTLVRAWRRRVENDPVGGAASFRVVGAVTGSADVDCRGTPPDRELDVRERDACVVRGVDRIQQKRISSHIVT
jgi:hypothetical protein